MTKQQIKTGAASLLVGLLAPVALLVPSVSAVEIFWDGGSYVSPDGLFSTGANWVGGISPTDGDSAILTAESKYDYASATARSLVNDISNLSLLNLGFDGESLLSSTSFDIAGNGLTINSAINANVGGTGGDHKVGTDVSLGSDVTFKTLGSNTLQVGEEGTTLDLGTNDLTLQPDGGTITLAGEIDGSGNTIINGAGKINMLAKGATGYTGATTITSGVFETSAETEGNVVINGGTLKGNSSLLGTVTMSAGSIEPGMSPGCLGTGDLTLTGGTYVVELDGNTVCTEYDQTTVVGSVDLGSASTLDVQRLASFDPAVNDTFAIILNDGTDAVLGTFVDLANGSEFTIDGYTYQINYDAGDGNDVLLLVKATPSAPDTGIGSLLSSPLAAVAATFAALSVVGGLKFAEQRRK
jgi:hypothetical protein